MRKTVLFTFIVFGILPSFLVACKEKKSTLSEEKNIELNEESVSAFGVQIENSVMAFNPDFFNRAFDKAYIRNVISDNSIVYSSLDTDFGQAYFESNFKMGNDAMEVVENGGDFKFVRYYEKEGESHIIMRTYRDYTIVIDDYIVDTSGSALKIKDGFNYNLSTDFSNQVRYNVFFNVMNRTHPEGDTRLLLTVRSLLTDGNAREARRLLEENKTALESYPYYLQYYIQSVYETDKDHYIRLLGQLEEEGFDHRSVLLHMLLFYVHQGMPSEAEKVIDELITYTGDDPIYLFMFGVANFNAGQYETALYCYENAASGMPMIWDIWYGKLECLAKMERSTEFRETLNEGEKAYNMSPYELEELAKRNFPGILTD